LGVELQIIYPVFPESLSLVDIFFLSTEKVAQRTGKPKLYEFFSVEKEKTGNGWRRYRKLD